MLAGIQRQAAERLPAAIQFDHKPRFVGQRQQMSAALIELQTGKITHEQSGFVFIDMYCWRFGRIGKARDFINLDWVALFSDEQASAGRIVREALEALVAVEVDAQRKL